MGENIERPSTAATGGGKSAEGLEGWHALLEPGRLSFSLAEVIRSMKSLKAPVLQEMDPNHRTSIENRNP